MNTKPQNPSVHFKLSCLYSNLEQTDNAFFHLAKAVEKGFYDFDRIKTHDHLAYLRTRQPDFDKFVNNGYRLIKPITASNQFDISDALISQIEKLAKLKDQGIINEEEFNTQKSKLLNH